MFDFCQLDRVLHCGSEFLDRFEDCGPLVEDWMVTFPIRRTPGSV